MAERFHLFINRYFWFLGGVRKFTILSQLENRLDGAKTIGLFQPIRDRAQGGHIRTLGGYF